MVYQYCACSLTDVAGADWDTDCNAAIFNFTACFPCYGSQNVCCDKRPPCCHLLCLIRLVFLNSSFRSSLIVIRKLLTCRFATLRDVPLHEILFALTSHSLSMTSSLLLIRFAIFRALDIYSANSVNIVFLQQPRLVWSKPELMAIAAYIYCWFSCVILLSAS